MLIHDFMVAALFSTSAAADSCFFKMYPSGNGDIFVDCGGELGKAHRHGSMWTGVMSGPGSRLIQIIHAIQRTYLVVLWLASWNLTTLFAGNAPHPSRVQRGVRGP
jgi:hypothetical protein